MNLFGFQGITTKIDMRNKNGKHIKAMRFPSISVGSVIPRRVAPQQSPLLFHRTLEDNTSKQENKGRIVSLNQFCNVEDTCPDGK